MIIEGEYGVMHLSVSLAHKWTFLKGNSGEGKSYLFRLLPKLAPFIDKRIKSIDYTALQGDILKEVEGYDLVCLDNADLYLTQELIDNLDKLNCQFLVSIKKTAHLSVNDYAIGNISYVGKTLSYRENNWKDRMYGKDSTLFRGR